MTYEELISEPCLTPIHINGKVFTRTHPQKCCQCGSTFFGYIPEDTYWEPYRVSTEPELLYGMANGLRGTCGKAQCYEREVHHQLERSPKYRNAVAEYQKRLDDRQVADKPIPKLKKLGS